MSDPYSPQGQQPQQHPQEQPTQALPQQSQQQSQQQPTQALPQQAAGQQWQVTMPNTQTAYLAPGEQPKKGVPTWVKVVIPLAVLAFVAMLALFAAVVFQAVQQGLSSDDPWDDPSGGDPYSDPYDDPYGDDPYDDPFGDPTADPTAAPSPGADPNAAPSTDANAPTTATEPAELAELMTNLHSQGVEYTGPVTAAGGMQCYKPSGLTGEGPAGLYSITSIDTTHTAVLGPFSERLRSEDGWMLIDLMQGSGPEMVSTFVNDKTGDNIQISGDNGIMSVMWVNCGL